MTAAPATRSTAERLVLRAAAGLALGYILLPLVLISWLAFFLNPVVSFPPEGYTFRWFRAILDQRNFVDGFLMSLGIGVQTQFGDHSTASRMVGLAHGKVSAGAV
jgi:putative spermidine/putrescine transport system permease protein